MMSTIPTIEDFIKGFPNQIPKHDRTPTYDSLTETCHLLKANAASVLSTRGAGNNGYLGLIIPPALYATITAEPFVHPVFPAANPIIPPGATAAQIQLLMWTHAKNKCEWRECENVESALMKQLISSIDPIYLRAQRNHHTGFANILLLDLLTFLFTSYEQLMPQQLQKNVETLNKQWDPNMPFETLIDQIEDAIEMAAAGNQPITDPQIITSVYTNVFNTGLYFDDCKMWDWCPEAEKTWLNFKMHFLEAQCLLHLQQLTMQQAGFHGVHAMMQQEDEVLQNTASALANLAMATVVDHQGHATLIETNKTLANSIKKLQEENDDLKQQLAVAKSNHQDKRLECDPNG